MGKIELMQSSMNNSGKYSETIYKTVNAEEIFSDIQFKIHEKAKIQNSYGVARTAGRLHLYR